MPFLSVRDLDSGYGKKQVLSDVGLDAGRGEIVSLIGHNGAGKTTLLRTVFGHITPSRGEIKFDDQSMAGVSQVQRVARGMTYTPQEHFVFGDLSVSENLHLAARGARSEKDRTERFEHCFEHLPILKERGKQTAATLSGGQQRMLSLGMTLVLRPTLLLLDEPSLGLAPSLVDSVMELLLNLAAGGMTILLVEQNIQKAFSVADYVYVLRGGRIIAERTGGSVTSHDELWNWF
jgi:branched-chain amino acid transport system ATP-binding protein